LLLAPSGPPKTVDTILTNFSSLSVIWKAPEISEQNGLIIYYEVEIISLDVNHTELVNISNESLILTDLHSFYTYSIRVAASTSAGLGPYSTPVFYLIPPSSKFVSFLSAIFLMDTIE